MAFDPLVVLTGDAKFGTAPAPATSYKSEISTIEVSEQRATVVIPPTLATAAEGKKAGAYSATVTINVIGDLQATSLYTLLRDAVRNATPIYMDAFLKPGAIGPANPKYSAALVVTEAKVGAASGSLSAFSLSMPVDGLVATATA